jgi:hypothetical protein
LQRKAGESKFMSQERGPAVVVTMSGTQRMAELVGELANATPEAAKHTAKVLRSAVGPDGKRLGLWPSPGRGVRTAAFTATHLVNLLLALSCGEPVKAEKTVTLLRGLRPMQTNFIRVERREGHPNLLFTGVAGQTTFIEETRGEDPVLPGDCLGECLDFLVEAFAVNAAYGYHRVGAKYGHELRSIEVQITVEPQQSAEITRTTEALIECTSYRLTPAQPDLPEQSHQSLSKLKRIFDGGAFEALAHIWNDAKASMGNALPTSGQGASTNETAASPGREAAAARDRPAEADGCSVQAHPTGEREKSQPPSVSRLGHSQQPDRRVADDEPREGAAFDAAA